MERCTPWTELLASAHSTALQPQREGDTDRRKTFRPLRLDQLCGPTQGGGGDRCMYSL